MKGVEVLVARAAHNGDFVRNRKQRPDKEDPVVRNSPSSQVQLSAASQRRQLSAGESLDSRFRRLPIDFRPVLKVQQPAFRKIGLGGADAIENHQEIRRRQINELAVVVSYFVTVSP